jgi:hypothetical protein
MGWSVHTAFLNDRHQSDLLEKYGDCCDTPLVRTIYSIDSEQVEPQDGNFIGFDCLICSSVLYTSSKTAHTCGSWLTTA